MSSEKSTLDTRLSTPENNTRHTPGAAAEAADELANLLLPHGARRAEPARGEEVVGAHGAEPPPERAGAGEPQDGALVVPERARGVGDRPPRQEVVVPVQHVARGRGGGGHDDVGAAAEPQGHDGAVRLREPGEHLMQLAVEVVYVAEKWQRGGARRPPCCLAGDPPPHLVFGGNEQFVEDAGGEGYAADEPW